MDKASLIGSILGVIACAWVAFRASHGHFEIFWSEKGVVMVFGGTLSVLFMAMPMEGIKAVPGYIKRFLFEKGMSPVETVKLMSTLADKARRDGILALESEIEKIKDPFLVQGLKMAVDGTDEATIEATLRLEVMAMQERHKSGKKFFDLIKLYGPGYGLVATLIGQIGMFGNLGGDIETLGHMLAVAVVATMYGTVLANAIAGPIGDKLALRSGQEILSKEMMLQGIMSIQAGDNPRATQEKMLAFVPQSVRVTMKAAA
ncbi:MAG: MotA/TolQ/ExbB proton channel family protein [Phycisphaerae bacterium]|nr:MotA/TolQ/ExbB proton channel family protein [Phycisphaerae bacterium]